MNYKLGNSRRVADLGLTQEQSCPKCREVSAFPVYKNLNFELMAKPPFLTMRRYTLPFAPIVCKALSSPIKWVMPMKREMNGLYAAISLTCRIGTAHE